MAKRNMWWSGWMALVGALTLAMPSLAAEDDILGPDFDDSPLTEPVETPDWFKLSFLDLREDLNDAREAGKRGLIVYFGQKFCPYCKVLLERDLAKDDIRTYTQKHFDVVGIDTRDSRQVTDLDGEVLPEHQYADRHEAQFTPTLLFYDPSGREALKLVGYQPPYELRAALEYVADGHHREESFRDYLARAEPVRHADGELNQEGFFAPQPHALDRSRIAAERPLLVVFEQTECHACDVLHAGPLRSDVTRELLQRFEVVQLNMRAPTPVITPGGQRTSSRDWADRLGLYYTPTLIFFDSGGEEIIRVSSVVHFNRLQGVLRYVLEKGYLKYESFQDWRKHVDPDAAAS